MLLSFIILQDPLVMEVLVEAHKFHNRNLVNGQELESSEFDLIFWKQFPLRMY